MPVMPAVSAASGSIFPLSAHEASDTWDQSGSVPPAHCHIALSPDRIRTKRCLWMPVIIQEYVPMLCYSCFAGGGMMLLVTKKNAFYCCLLLVCPAGTHHRICKKGTNSSTLQDSSTFIYLFSSQLFHKKITL